MGECGEARLEMGKTGLKGLVEGMVEEEGVGSEEGNDVVLGDAEGEERGEGLVELRERGVEKGRVARDEGVDERRGKTVLLE